MVKWPVIVHHIAELVNAAVQWTIEMVWKVANWRKKLEGQNVDFGTPMSHLRFEMKVCRAGAHVMAKLAIVIIAGLVNVVDELMGSDVSLDVNSQL